MVPAQNRPCGSQIPSFIRTSIRPASGCASSRITPASSTCRKPGPAASTYPPPTAGAAAPTWQGIWNVCRTWSWPSAPGRPRCSCPARTSTHSSSSRAASQRGPSLSRPGSGEQGVTVHRVPGGISAGPGLSRCETGHGCANSMTTLMSSGARCRACWPGRGGPAGSPAVRAMTGPRRRAPSPRGSSAAGWRSPSRTTRCS